MTKRHGYETEGQSYSFLFESVKQNQDLVNNTAIIIDDERGIRKIVAKTLLNFAPDLMIYEELNGKEGFETLDKIRHTYKKVLC